jgi:hypothetical protein
MAIHDVSFRVPTSDLGKADIEFDVFQDGRKFGTLKISKGSIVWFPRDTTNGHRADWERFDQLMQTHIGEIERR